jgi:hypothetical protein
MECPIIIIVHIFILRLHQVHEVLTIENVSVFITILFHYFKYLTKFQTIIYDI